MTLKELWDTATSFAAVSGYLAAGAGVVGMHLFTRYKNRRLQIRWAVDHEHMAGSSSHPQLGTVKVLYNDVEVPSMHFLRIEFENMSSSRDVQNLHVRLTCDADSKILGDWVVLNYDALLYWTPRFQEVINRLVALPTGEPGSTADWNIVFCERDFIVPVLNREQRFQIALVARNDAGRIPIVHVGGETVGVTFQQLNRRPQLMGVDHAQATLLGSVAAGVIAVSIAKALGISPMAAFIAYMLGNLCFVAGAGLIYAGRWLRKLAG